MLQGRTWRGNVRELRTVVERAVVLSDAMDATDRTELKVEHFVPDTPAPPAEPAGVESEPETAARVPSSEATDATPASLARELRDLERARVVAALEATHGNQSKAARMLGISRAKLIHRMKTFGISSSRSRPSGPLGDDD